MNLNLTPNNNEPRLNNNANNSDIIADQVQVNEEAIDVKICSCGKNPGGVCGCSTGGGCGCSSKSSTGTKNCGGCSKKSRCSCTKGTHKLEVFDWLCDLPEAQQETQMVEVQFKNTRKAYFLNSNNLDLYKGDMVAVEAMPGHDIGEVTLTGKLVLLQMKKNNYRVLPGEQKRVYRIAKAVDIEKYNEAKALEYNTMLAARQIAEELNLNMKISDVEYQGDGNKAIFYYIADERVDFRQLIKVYAERFRVKIEMKQIGARQEAGRVGGIGPCGRELCCSSSMSNFVSVSTSAARLQDISLNPQKLAGQCGKLKCCLNYEVDVYVEAQRKLPSRETILETKDASFYHFKTDILSGMISYSTAKNIPANLVTISKDRAFEIIKMNKYGKKPLELATEEDSLADKPVSKDILEQGNIDRFDSGGNNNPRRKKKINKINDSSNTNSIERKRPESSVYPAKKEERRPNRQPENREETKDTIQLTTSEDNNQNEGGDKNNKRKFHKKRPYKGNNARRENNPDSENEKD